MSEIIKLSLKKRLAISQIGNDGKLKPSALMNELQAIAETHASILGLGRAFCLTKNITWVLVNYIVDISEMPNDQEELTFNTWPSAHEGLYALRDFEIRGSNGRILIKAISRWILIDLTTRRPLRLSDYLQDWPTNSEHVLEPIFDKLTMDTEHHTIIAKFDIRYDDIDSNNHVNNAVYVLWATETLGFDFLNSHKLRGIKVNFKKEIQCGATDLVFGAAVIKGNNTYHTISTGDTINALVVCNWENR